MVAEHSLAPLIATWMIWIRCLDCHPLHQDAPSSSHIITSRMVDSLEHCSTDSDCGNTAILQCDHERRHCVCRESYSVLVPPGECLRAKQFGEACSHDAQCQLFDKHAVCTDDFCACDSGFYDLHDTNGTLCGPGGATEAPSPHLDQNMIIVIVVLAFMFLGICVALHLFSRARFGNRRTIFNSPHPRLMQHLRLGKKKTKLSDRHHHHLPPPGHLVPRHHSFSGQGHHSPLPNIRVPKTRSHECLRSALSRESSPKFEPRCKTAPLAEKESLPSSEDLVKKTPEPLSNGPANLVAEDSLAAPGSPTVIITDADGSHTVVTSTSPSANPNAAVNV